MPAPVSLRARDHALKVAARRERLRIERRHFAADHALGFWSPTPTTNDRGLLFPAAAWLTRAVQPGRSRVVVLGASLAGLFAALQFAPKKAPPIKAAQRIRGLRLTATDVDWTTGNGPPVEGTGEALLMALAGRPAAPSGTVRPGRSDPRRADGGLR